MSAVSSNFRGLLFMAAMVEPSRRAVKAIPAPRLRHLAKHLPGDDPPSGQAFDPRACRPAVAARSGCDRADFDVANACEGVMPGFAAQLWSESNASARGRLVGLYALLIGAN